jgi:hypothetical protein
MLLPSGIGKVPGKVPTPIVHPDVWDCEESYTIRMLLACRLKIIPTSNLKLIISFLVLHMVLLHSFKLLSFVASAWHTPLTPRVYLRLANRPSAQFANSFNKNDLQATGTGTTLSVSHGRVSVAQVSHCGALRANSIVASFPTTFSMQEIKKDYYPRYIQGPNFESSSAKHRVLLSKN